MDEENATKQKKSREVNYKAFLGVGICFVSAGVAISIGTKNPGLMGLSVIGIAFIAISMKNKDKWKK